MTIQGSQVVTIKVTGNDPTGEAECGRFRCGRMHQALVTGCRFLLPRFCERLKYVSKPHIDLHTPAKTYDFFVAAVWALWCCEAAQVLVQCCTRTSSKYSCSTVQVLVRTVGYASWWGRWYCHRRTDGNGNQSSAASECSMLKNSHRPHHVHAAQCRYRYQYRYGTGTVVGLARAAPCKWCW